MTRSAEIVACLDGGDLPHVLAARYGLSVKRLLSLAKLERIRQNTRHQLVALQLSSTLLSRLQPAAQARRISVDVLVSRLLCAVVDDDLIAAILDD